MPIDSSITGDLNTSNCHESEYIRSIPSFYGLGSPGNQLNGSVPLRMAIPQRSGGVQIQDFIWWNLFLIAYDFIFKSLLVLVITLIYQSGEIGQQHPK